MGFLIFAYRKLSLTRQINSKQFEQTMLGQQHEKYQQQISELQMSKQQRDEAQKSFSTMVTSATNSIFQLGQMATQQKFAQTQQDAYNTMNNKNATDEDKNAAKAAVGEAYKNMIQESMGMNIMQQGIQTGMAAYNKVNTMVSSASEEAELNELNKIDSRITLKLKSNETELKLMSAELENIEKAEADAVKSAAPKFGQ